jgi:hypothetical protein
VGLFEGAAIGLQVAVILERCPDLGMVQAGGLGQEKHLMMASASAETL